MALVGMGLQLLLNAMGMVSCMMEASSVLYWTFASYGYNFFCGMQILLMRFEASGLQLGAVCLRYAVCLILYCPSCLFIKLVSHHTIINSLLQSCHVLVCRHFCQAGANYPGRSETGGRETV